MKLNPDIYGVVPEQHGVKTDFVVPICMFILFLIGVVFIYSAQSYTIDAIPLQKQFWLKQIFFIGIAVIKHNSAIHKAAKAHKAPKNL